MKVPNLVIALDAQLITKCEPTPQTRFAVKHPELPDPRVPSQHIRELAGHNPIHRLGTEGRIKYRSRQDDVAQATEAKEQPSW
jgi:hypothetical protein